MVMVKKSGVWHFKVKNTPLNTHRSLMSRNACNGENGETGEKSPAAGD